MTASQAADPKRLPPEMCALTSLHDDHTGRDRLGEGLVVSFVWSA
jgi:hypothetical protein